jgi:hypothetical protein
MAELLLKKKNQDTLFIKINNKIIDKMAKYKFPKYKDNLSGDEKFIYSYNTAVAKIDHKNRVLIPLGYWSTTTSKHINYAAAQMGYKKL